MFAVKIKIEGFWASLKTRPAKPLKTELPPMFAATKTNVVDDAIEVEDDSTAPGSSKESGNKRGHEKKPLQLRTSFEQS